MKAHRRVALVLAVGLVMFAPTASAGIPSFPEVVSMLTLGAGIGEGALVELALRGQGASRIDDAERAVSRYLRDDPLALLELERLPAELIGALTVDKLGPIRGPFLTDIPTETALGAVALSDGTPIPSSSLRSFTERASVGNEPSDLQRDDLAALFDG